MRSTVSFRSGGVLIRLSQGLGSAVRLASETERMETVRAENLGGLESSTSLRNFSKCSCQLPLLSPSLFSEEFLLST